MTKEDILEEIKNNFIEYNKIIEAKKVIKILLEKYGYFKTINVEEDLRNICLDSIEKARENNIDVPNSYYLPIVSISIMDLKKTFILFMNQEFNKLNVLSNLYGEEIIERQKNVLFDIFVNVYRDLNNYVMNIEKNRKLNEIG